MNVNLSQVDLSGSYEGFYEMGTGYILPQFGKRVKYWVKITELNGKFTGKVSEEESEFSVPHPAKIEGHIEGEMLFFKKNYTPETIDFADILDSESWNQSDFDEIVHAGFIDHANNCIYGDWVIETHLLKEDGTKEDEPYFFRGIWFLSKVQS